MPDLSSPAGWFDIIYVVCVVILMLCLDHRNYGGPGTPTSELREASAVQDKYVLWCAWLAGTYTCTTAEGEDLEWEKDIFSVSAPLNFSKIF
jgi:hypothetical protein